MTDSTTSTTSESILERARVGFADHFGPGTRRDLVRPGRVNLIGEHTEYNEGFVLPFGIGRRT